MAEGPAVGVARRTAMAGVLATVVLPAAACGIRLEDDAPRVPLVPTRTPVPGEAELVALTRDTAALAELAATTPGDLAADLATIHRRQHTVLRATLLRRHVPEKELDAGADAPGDATASPSPTASASEPSGSGGTTPTPSATPVAPRVRLTRAEAAAAATAGAYAEVETDLRATVASLHAQRYAAASLLRGRPPVVPRDPVAGPEVGELAGLTSAATYFLEVVSARSQGRQRERSDATLAALRELRSDQLAGGTLPDEAIGHPLPFEVTDAADAARLARQVLTTLRASYGEHLERLVSDHGADGSAAATRWLGTVEVEAHRWGVPLSPFPGLE